MTVRTADGTPRSRCRRIGARRRCSSPAQAAELAAPRRADRGSSTASRWTSSGRVHDGRFAIVQARPITALPEPAAGPRRRCDWELPDPNGRYMRASVIELLPDPLSPLFATLGSPAWYQARWRA